MGKKRNADKKSLAGAGGSATRSTNHGGGGSKNSKFSAFEFNDEDMRVEEESRKAVAKFGAKSPNKKPIHSRESIDKYELLASCVDPADRVSQHRTFGRDVALPFGPLNCELESLSFLQSQSSERTCEAKSSMGMRRTGCRTAGKNHNNILHLDSDEDERPESGSLGSSINVGGNEGSFEEQSSEYSASDHDCETMVSVSPYYVKYGNIYYTRCLLTFSSRCIRLEDSVLCDTQCVEWSTSDILNIEHQRCESANAEVINLYLRCKGANADETGNSNLCCHGSVELEFVIDDPQWSGKEEEIKSLDMKYKAAWKTNVCECYSEESFEEVVYPAGDPDAVFISRRDIELLQPRTFINDTIIDFYTKYLLKKTRAEERCRFHFFNSFFFQKLSSVKDACGEKDAFQSVCKWTRNIDIFEKDYIFIPVNFSLHWSLIIICHPGEIANLRNKNMNKASIVPCILHMDSIRGSHRGLKNVIRRYLWEEWKERGNAQEENISLKFLNLDFVSPQLPQQENLFDCGLFLLHYAELFLELATNCSTTKYGVLNQHWFLPAEVSLKKRDHIRKIIYWLIEDNALNDPPDASSNKFLQELSTSKGESSAESIPENSGEELCCEINFSVADHFDTMGKHCFVPMLEPRSIRKSTTKECFQPCKLQVPINQFNNLNFPLEINALQDGEMMDDLILQPGGASKTFSDEFVVNLGVQIGEDRPTEAAYGSERQKAGGENCSVSFEDLMACVVEDSEDEIEVKSIQRTRRVLLS